MFIVVHAEHGDLIRDGCADTAARVENLKSSIIVGSHDRNRLRQPADPAGKPGLVLLPAWLAFSRGRLHHLTRAACMFNEAGKAVGASI